MSSNVLDALANGRNGAEPKVEVKRPIIHDDNGTVDVIAYNANSDPHAQAFLPWLWNRLVEDGLVGLYFPGAEQTGFAAFVKLFSSDTNVLLVRKLNDQGEVVDVVGFATLELMPFGMAMAAHAGFIFTKAYWDHKTSKASADEIVRTWFNWSAPRLDVVIGIIADRNVMARRFLQRIGWKHSGNIPLIHQFAGERSDGSIWFITRDMVEGKEG